MAEVRTELAAFDGNSEHTFASKFDNMHVLLWLIKDTCWMLEWRVLGTAMILPTIAVAVVLAARSRFERLFWINLAICFWISGSVIPARPEERCLPRSVTLIRLWPNR